MGGWIGGPTFPSWLRGSSFRYGVGSARLSPSPAPRGLRKGDGRAGTGLPEQNGQWAEAMIGARHGGGASTTIILVRNRRDAAVAAVAVRRVSAHRRGDL